MDWHHSDDADDELDSDDGGSSVPVSDADMMSVQPDEDPSRLEDVPDEEENEASRFPKCLDPSAAEDPAQIGILWKLLANLVSTETMTQKAMDKLLHMIDQFKPDFQNEKLPKCTKTLLNAVKRPTIKYYDIFVKDGDPGVFEVLDRGLTPSDGFLKEPVGFFTYFGLLETLVGRSSGLCHE